MANKILIVEDEFIVANDLRLILVQSGYQVIGIAPSAEEAEVFLTSNTPDLVLLDIQLDGKKSGIDLARELRARHIAFVYLSANSNRKILEQAKTTEPYGFLVKPFREKDLLVTLDIAWYRHQFSQESRFRHQERLRQQLDDILTSKDQDKCLATLRVLQVHVPFDLVLFDNNKPDTTDRGYSRTGFDEYQLITENEILNVCGLDAKTLAVLKNKANPADHVMDLSAYIMKGFRMESHLEVPIAMNDGSVLSGSFYSRKPQVYHSDHADLIKLISRPLQDCFELADTAGSAAVTALTKTHPSFKGIIGNHPLLLEAMDLVTHVAPFNTSVLILGESGTGKESIAQSIHTLSGREKRPFIKVNCAAMPPTLIESELFGHERGAFTGAIEKRKGKFEQADGGTIFLDEIGELPLGMQVKLLRVLQEKEIEYVGGTTLKKLNVRIIAATNRNLEKEVAAGNFRLDLYYRLNVFPITLPSLRDRKDDIPVLAAFFAEKFCKEFNKPFAGISDAMLRDMDGYKWPGNIRELENIIEQSVILSESGTKIALKRMLSVDPADFIAKPAIETLEDVKQLQMETEKDYIVSILKKTFGRIRGSNGAAELLNIKPTTLESKMAKLGIKGEDFKKPLQTP